MATNPIEEVWRAGGYAMPLRVYGCSRTAGAKPLVLHLHGGAFVARALDAGGVVSSLLADAGAVVLSPEYPLAPKHPFPQALEAAFALLNWLQANRTRWAGKKSPLFVAGEEAGGNLAAALALMARDQRQPVLAGQILLSPMLDASMATCSLRAADAGPVGCKWADGWHRYLGSAAKAAHPYAAPLGSSRLAGLPPALIVTAEDDPMRDESRNYARRLRESGVAVRDHVLTAPTGWPDALTRSGPVEANWSADVARQFSAFFSDTVAASRASRPLALHHT
jgi:acetyl esterase/lipase